MALTQNHVYVHSNPPKAISGSGAAIRQWVKHGDVEKLEKMVLEGQGARLLGLAESAQEPKVRAFLRSIPGYMAKVDLIHDAVSRGSLRETQALIDKKKLAAARDAVGRGIGHKAVIYNNKTILEWMAKKHSDIFNLKDNEGRTCLHYTAASRDPEEMYKLLVNLGADPDVIDMHGRKANYYISHPDELDIEGPVTRSLSRGKRRRISPISPPKRKMLVSPPSITRAQIRIWIHEKDILNLENIVWSGHGDKLLLETTNNGKVRKFLENVPHLLARIKSIHSATINNDLEGLKEIRSKTELNEIFKAKDLHGLTPLHKAAGLGHRAVMEYLLYEIPGAIDEVDNEGRTPLHYAARDPNVYTFLIKDGSNENISDQKGKTAAYYSLHPGEIDVRHLRNVPDAPRVTGDLSGWDRSTPPLILGYKRRTSSGEFSGDSKETVVSTGKYDLSNVELNGDDLNVDDTEFTSSPSKPLSGDQLTTEALKNHSDSTANENTLTVESEKADEPMVVEDEAFEPKVDLKDETPDTTPDLEMMEVETLDDQAPPETTAADDEFFDNEEQHNQANAGVDEVETTGKPEEISISNANEAVEQAEEATGDIQLNPADPTENLQDIGPTAEKLVEETEAAAEKVLDDVNSTAIELKEGVNAAGETLRDEFNDNAAEVKQKVDDAKEMLSTELNDAAAEVKQEVEATTDMVADDMNEAAAELKEQAETAAESLQDQLNEAATEAKEQVETGAGTVAEELTNAENGLKNEIEANTAKVEEVVATVEEQPGPDNSVEDTTPAEANSEEEKNVGEVNSENGIADASVDPAIAKSSEDEEDEEVETALLTGDIETLVNKILEGKGAELLNRQSGNPEVQEFLSNVPAYLAKIASIHYASSSGNLRDLQSLLDRKRLAVAQDTIGRGPLHLAVLNNHATIARYLAGNYPQSLRLLDRNGRSALHFAATLPDSGTMYKYLVNLGADPNVKDQEGNTPGIYLRNRELLTHQQLLKENGNSFISTAAIAGQEATTSERWERPKTPSASTLSTLETFYNSTLMERESLWRKAWRRLTHQNDSSLKTLVQKYLDRDTFELIKKRGMSDGSSLLDILKFYPQFFIIAPGEEAYDVYQELFVPAIVDHNLIAGEFTGSTSILGNTFSKISEDDGSLVTKIPKVDIPSKFVKQVRIRVSRNIRPFPFVPQMKKEDLFNVTTMLKTVQLNWPCYDLEALNKEELEELKVKCWIPEASKICRLWPKQRYFYLSEDGNVQVWMNAEDHLDFVISSKYGKLLPMLITLNDIYSIFNDTFKFYENTQFGYLTVNPFRAGTGMKITFRIRLPQLMRFKDELNDLCSVHNLSIHWKKNRIQNDEIEPDDWIELENNTTLGKTELQLALEIANAINLLIQAEEDKARLLLLAAKEANKKRH